MILLPPGQRSSAVADGHNPLHVIPVKRDELILQRRFVILGVAVPDMERPPLDDRQLCGLTIMRWPLATA